MEAASLLEKLTENEPSWLKEFRSTAFKAFENSKPENTELFKHQSLFNDFNLEEFGAAKDNKEKLDFNLADDVAFFLQTSDEVKISLPKYLREKGIVVAKLDEKIKNDNQFKQVLISDSKLDDKFMQMNDALFNSGLFIYIPKNVQLEIPFRIISNVNSHLISKTIIIVDQDSTLKVVKEDYSQHSDKPILFSDSMHVLLRDGAELHFSHIQNLSQNVVHVANKVSTCHKNSRIYWNSGYFGGKKVRSRVYSLLLGEGSEGEDLEVLFGNKEQQFDLFSDLLHTGKNTNGRVLTNGVLLDKSNAILKGMIKISEFAKNSNSFLGQHVMLLSRESRAKAIPGLEIETNEVKATHSASVSQIEEDKIFYLMSRGLSEFESKKMIASGFFEPAIRQMYFDEIKNKISYLIELKWEGKEEEFLKHLDEFKGHTDEKVRKEPDLFSGHYKYR